MGGKGYCSKLRNGCCSRSPPSKAPRSLSSSLSSPSPHQDGILTYDLSLSQQRWTTQTYLPERHNLPLSTVDLLPARALSPVALNNKSPPFLRTVQRVRQPPRPILHPRSTDTPILYTDPPSNDRTLYRSRSRPTRLLSQDDYSRSPTSPSNTPNPLARLPRRPTHRRSPSLATLCRRKERKPASRRQQFEEQNIL